MYNTLTSSFGGSEAERISLMTCRIKSTKFVFATANALKINCLLTLRYKVLN